MQEIYLLQIDGDPVAAWTYSPTNAILTDKIGDVIPHVMCGDQIDPGFLDARYNTPDKFYEVLREEGWAEVRYVTVKLSKVELDQEGEIQIL